MKAFFAGAAGAWGAVFGCCLLPAFLLFLLMVYLVAPLSKPAPASPDPLLLPPPEAATPRSP